MTDRTTPFTDPWMAEEGTRWVAQFATLDRALAAARDGLTRFGLLAGFHRGLARFEAAVRAEVRDRTLAEAIAITDTVIGPLWHPDTQHEITERLRAARARKEA